MKFLKVVLIALGLSLSAHAARLETDVVDTAVASPDFKTLVTAVVAADLVDTLKSEGPFTVFAPTDEAFAKLPAGTVEALLNDIPTLTKILTFHVVAKEVTPFKLKFKKSLTTVQGEKVEITKRNGKTYINDSKILASLKVKNGIIYVIDSVLLPKL